MKTLDRYILTEFLGPFLFGLGIFFTLLVGVDMLYDALQMAISQKIPVRVVCGALGYRIPTLIALTVPMGTMFASLMCFARLSSDGELIAIRVGGTSVRRISLPLIVLAAAFSLVLAVLIHTAIPVSNGLSRRVIAEYQGKAKTFDNLMLRVPRDGPLERIVYVDRLDLNKKSMQWVVIHEFHDNRPLATLVAKSARWGGHRWVLEEVEHTRVTPQGVRSERLTELSYDLGRTPEDLSRIQYKTMELSTADLRAELRVVRTGPAADKGRANEIRTEIATRWATPWSVLGMALVGVAFGVRPQRTSRGVALGISLAVILLYYIVMHTMTILGEQGRLPAPMCAWVANLALYIVGLLGLFSHDT
ncbi:MAG: LptF/LptG family permease [Armatimonadota bacterium]